ncbi:MAG: pantetheine-phosphate adenylyltransferase [Gemmatimonadota bacterium]|jgi:pantetheine-phosphate adenylyltransferase
MTQERPLRGIYPGSFDPITKGHEDIVRRALAFCDAVVVAVASRPTHAKPGLFDIEERVAMIREVFHDVPRVEVTAFNGLLVEFARAQDASVIVRGLRAVSDFEYEFQMALMNRQLWPGTETLFLAPDPHYSYLSSSLVREIAALGADVSEFVSPPVRARLASRFGRGIEPGETGGP